MENKKETTDNPVIFSLSLPTELIQAFEKTKMYKQSLNRNEAIRAAIRAAISKELEVR